jgi:serine acetyltransferase
MAVLANVALTNTFDTWRLRTNALLTRVNQFTINESAFYANTLTANVRFVSSGSTRLGTTGSNRTIVNGLLTVNGNITISGNTSLNGNINLGDASTDLLTVTGRATVGQNLTVSGNTTFGGAGKVSNTTGWFGVLGRQSISTNLFVGANTFVMGNLGVGLTNPSAKIHSYSSAATANYIIAQHSSTYNSGVQMTNSQGTWYLYTAGSSNQFEIFGGTSATSQFTIAPSGAVTVTRSATITQNLTVSGNTTINGTTTDKSNALSQTLTDGATISWDTSLGRVATVTLGGARTLAAPTNLKVGTYILNVLQDATGSRTLTWNAVFKWTGGVAPVLTTTANARDVFSFFSDGTNLYGSYLPDVK